jgi:hypothetical protein
MKIAIFETEHFEGAFPVIKLFDIPGNEINIFTSAETFKRFNDLFLNDTTKYNWIILPTGKLRAFYLFYKKLKEKNPDILYINTISSNHLLYSFILWLIPLKKIIITVHDINCLFESRFSWNFRKAIIHLGKKWLIKQVNEFNVVADTMIASLQAKTKGKRAHNIPGAVFENRFFPQIIEEQLRIIVPGSLDKRRRNYEQVFEFATLADKEKLRLTIILLGGYFDEYGMNINVRANKFQSAFCKIISYDTQIVTQQEFDEQMDACHFVFIPSVIHTKICTDIPEVYGITKSSGNIFDVVKHAKPFIVPAGLVIPVNLQTSCFKYTSLVELADFLKNSIASPERYEYWQKKANENSRHYTIEEIRKRNSELFTNTYNDKVL